MLNESNTAEEMERKRREYFEAGVIVMWMVDPVQRSVSVFSTPEQHIELAEEDTLDGGDVLPGFSLALRDLFAELNRRAQPAPLLG